jgi:hypothetical protein
MCNLQNIGQQFSRNIGNLLHTQKINQYGTLNSKFEYFTSVLKFILVNLYHHKRSFIIFILL